MEEGGWGVMTDEEWELGYLSIVVTPIPNFMHSSLFLFLYPADWWWCCCPLHILLLIHHLSFTNINNTLCPLPLPLPRHLQIWYLLPCCTFLPPPLIIGTYVCCALGCSMFSPIHLLVIDALATVKCARTGICTYQLFIFTIFIYQTQMDFTLHTRDYIYLSFYLFIYLVYNF
jgi:hypothetical protein